MPWEDTLFQFLSSAIVLDVKAGDSCYSIPNPLQAKGEMETMPAPGLSRSGSFHAYLVATSLPHSAPNSSPVQTSHWSTAISLFLSLAISSASLTPPAQFFGHVPSTWPSPGQSHQSWPSPTSLNILCICFPSLLPTVLSQFPEAKDTSPQPSEPSPKSPHISGDGKRIDDLAPSKHCV